MGALIFFLCLIALGALVTIVSWTVEVIKMVVSGVRESGWKMIVMPIAGIGFLTAVIWGLVDIFKDW